MKNINCDELFKAIQEYMKNKFKNNIRFDISTNKLWIHVGFIDCDISFNDEIGIITFFGFAYHTSDPKLLSKLTNKIMRFVIKELNYDIEIKTKRIQQDKIARKKNRGILEKIRPYYIWDRWLSLNSEISRSANAQHTKIQKAAKAKIKD